MIGFSEYVFSFYGPGGVYPMGATMIQIIACTKIHKTILELQGKEFCADSYDRECIRDLLMSRYNLRWEGES